MARLLVIFFMCFNASIVTCAQEVIKGRVLGENGNGLSLCHVTSIQSGKHTTTDENGFFSIAISTLPHVLSFTHVKYDSRVLNVDSIYFIEIHLEPKSYTLDEVEIVYELPGSELTSDLKSITEVSSVFGENDISKYIITLSGVSSINSFDAGFSVRGGATTENQFLVEGMKIADPRHMSTLVTSFDPYVFNNSQIYKSGFPATYSGYLSSYIDMSTGQVDDEKTQIELSLGMVSSSAKVGTTIGKGKKHALKASARYSYLDLVSNVNDAFFTDQSIPNYRIFDYSMSYLGEIGKTWSIKAFSILSQDSMPLELGSGDVHQMDWGSYSLGLTAIGALGKNGFLRLGIAQNREGSDYLLQSVNEQKQSSSVSNTNLIVAYDLAISQKSSWKTGFKVEHNDYRLKSNEIRASTNNIYNGFTAYEYYSTYFNASIGVNVGRLNTIKSLDVSPRVKLDYKRPDLEVSLDYARTFQYEEYLPFFTVRTPIDIPVPLEADNNSAYVDQLSVGIYSDHINSLKFYAGAFHKTMHHVKEFTDGSRLAVEEIEMLEGEGYAFGTELEVKVELPKFMLRANYTWTQTKRRFKEINDGAYYSPPFDVNSSVMLSGAVNITNQLRFLALWTYSSGIYVTIPEGVIIAKDITDPASLVNYVPIYRDRYNYQLPSRHRLDLTLEYTKLLRKDAMKFTFGSYNTYNRQNPDFIFLDVESIDEFFVSFIPKSKVVVPFIPYLSFTYYINYAN